MLDSFTVGPFISFTVGPLTLFAEGPFALLTEGPFALLTEGPFALLTEGSFTSLTEGSLSLSAPFGAVSQRSGLSGRQPGLSAQRSITLVDGQLRRALRRQLR